MCLMGGVKNCFCLEGLIPFSWGGIAICLHTTVLRYLDGCASNYKCIILEIRITWKCENWLEAGRD